MKNNKIICTIAGNRWESTYVFDEYQLPKRCEVISVGLYAFDDTQGTYMMESDKCNYKQPKYQSHKEYLRK